MLRFTALAFLFFLFSPFAALPVVHGASITVSGSCDIVNAIVSANSNASVGGCTAGSSSGRDVITLTENVTLTANLLQITTVMRIEGGGHSISGNGQYSILSLAAGADVQVNNVVLTDAKFSSNGAAVYGGGGKLVMTNSVIKDSRADAFGGGVMVSGGANVTIANSTIYNNSAGNNGGGGVFVGGGTATLIHVTLKGNTTDAANAGGGIRVNSGTLYLYNSTIADSGSGKDCIKDGTGTLPIIGSVIKDGSCGQKARDPKLGSLTNGRYYPLQPSSEAIDNGDATYCDDYGYDQAGRARPATDCDSGSVEGPPKNIPSNISVAIDELWNWVVTFDPVAEASVYQIRYQGLPYDSRGESCQNKFWCEPYNTFTATRVSVSTWGLTCVEMQVRAGSGNPQNPNWGAWSHELAVRKPLWDCHGKLLNPTPGVGEDRTKTYQSRYQAVPYSYGQPQAQIAFEPEVQAARLPRDQRTTLASHVGQDSGAGGAEGQSFYSGGQQSQAAQVGGAGGPQSQSVGGGGPQSQSVGGANPANSAEGANVQPTPTPLSSCKVTAEAVVNVRDKPNMNGAVLHQLAQYEVRVAKSKLAGWYEIVFPNSGTGWVSGDWVATSGDCA